jgi:hypothetical protein
MHMVLERGRSVPLALPSQRRTAVNFGNFRSDVTSFVRAEAQARAA